jgi:poly(3-hydroxybutyrate) depolymerase
MDMPAEFIEQHCRRTFINRDLANGTLVVNGEHIKPQNIKKTALMTVEGGTDDISSPGQTIAAHRICSGVPRHMRYHHLQEGAGHYGSFEGSRYRKGIAPRQAAFIRMIGEQAGLRYSPMPAERKLIEPTRLQWANAKQGLALVAPAA